MPNKQHDAGAIVAFVERFSSDERTVSVFIFEVCFKALLITGLLLKVLMVLMFFFWRHDFGLCV